MSRRRVSADFLISVLSAFLFSLPAVAADWGGTYVYEAAFGRTAGDTGVTARYELRLDGRPGGECRIAIDGFQLDEELLCTAEVQGDALTLRFRAHGDGAAANRYGVVVYPPRAPLVSLRRAADGTLETLWFALATPDGKVPPRGRRFVRR